MNFSESISNKLTEVITSELHYDEDRKEVISYAIETTLLFCLGLFSLVIIGYSLNALMPTVIAAFFGSSLRRVSGGAHFDTPFKCLVFGTVVYCSIGVLGKKVVEYDLTNKYILFFILLVSFLLVAFLAPVDSESKPINSRSFKYKLKVFSLSFLIFTILVVAYMDNTLINVGAVLGVAYQSITLLPIFNMRRR